MSNNWDGKGLPEVGAIVSLAKRFPNPYQIRVVAIDEGNVVGRVLSGQMIGSYYAYKLDEIEPIKSDRDKAIEEMEQSMERKGYMLNPHVYAEFYDLGFRKQSEE